MAKKKPEFITFRCAPEVKEILTGLAEKEYRSLSQQLEFIVASWLREHGHLDKKD